jgi:hypothetical protein
MTRGGIPMRYKSIKNMTIMCDAKVQELIGNYVSASDIIRCGEGETSKQADRGNESYQKVIVFHSMPETSGLPQGRQ